MKPPGITSTFQMVRPTAGEDAVWRAVEEAISAGMTPQQFREEAAEAWEYLLREEGKAAAAELRKGRK